MTSDDIKRFLEAFGTAEWRLGIYEFARLFGKPIGDPWIAAKWASFKLAAEGLAAFDPGTLSKVLESPYPARPAELDPDIMAACNSDAAPVW